MVKMKKNPLIYLVMLTMVLVVLAGCTANAKVQEATVEAIAVVEKIKDPAGQCISCHEMKPEYYTWQISAHGKLACTTCHTKRKPTDYQNKHQNQAFSKPIKIDDVVPNTVCEQCHTTNRAVSPSGDLKIPHEKHLKAGVTCIKCHNGLVHAKISERGLTAKGDLSNYDAWNPEVAKKIVTPFYVKPNMWTCINCHKQLGITRKCGACHTTIPTLDSHDKPDWKAVHGQTARQAITECAKCHAKPDTPLYVTPSTGDKAVDFARAQEFCSKCHTQRPEMHHERMIKIHKQKVKDRKITNCLVCHNIDQPSPGENITDVFCNQCHWEDNWYDRVPNYEPPVAEPERADNKH